MSDDSAIAIDDGWKDGKYSFELSEALTTEDGPLSTVTLRKPTGADMMAVGNPVKFNPIADPPTIEIKDKEMAQMVARCAGITPVFVGKLSTKDLIQLGWILAPFFMPV